MITSGFWLGEADADLQGADLPSGALQGAALSSTELPDMESIIREQLKQTVDGGQLEEIMERARDLGAGEITAQSSGGSVLAEFGFDSVLDSAFSGESLFDSSEIIGSLKDLFFCEMRGALILGAEILLICIIIGVLNNLGSSFKRKEITDISTLVCTMVIIGISISSFKMSYRLCENAVDTMVYSMEILTPIMMGILVATGGVASSTLMNPLLMGAVTGFGVVIKKVILPALFASAVLSMVNSMTEKNYVGKMAKLLRSAAVVVTGLLVALLSAIIAIQGLISETSDGLLMSTAKYSLNTFIPIVGSFTSDTAELFIFCMSSIKRLVGVFGIVALLIMIIVPILKIMVVSVIYKLTAAVVEPISEGHVSEGINDIGSAMTTMCVVVFFCSLLFVIFLSIVVGMGGAAGVCV